MTIMYKHIIFKRNFINTYTVIYVFPFNGIRNNEMNNRMTGTYAHVLTVEL